MPIEQEGDVQDAEMYGMRRMQMMSKWSEGTSFDLLMES